MSNSGVSTGKRRVKHTHTHTRNFILNRLGTILDRVSDDCDIFSLLLKLKDRRFGNSLFDQWSHGIHLFAHLVAVKCEVFNTTSTREI